jgi:hypothetical protein
MERGILGEAIWSPARVAEVVRQLDDLLRGNGGRDGWRDLLLVLAPIALKVMHDFRGVAGAGDLPETMMQRLFGDRGWVAEYLAVVRSEGPTSDPLPFALFVQTNLRRIGLALVRRENQRRTLAQPLDESLPQLAAWGRDLALARVRS